MRTPITISLETEFIVKIDNAKGRNEPRSRFLEDIISDYLGKPEEKIPQPKVSKTTKSKETR
jgi:metal-responsive CopG/Arc/MetJ family transcriptional regulator